LKFSHGKAENHFFFHSFDHEDSNNSHNRKPQSPNGVNFLAEEKVVVQAPRITDYRL
jgi:hypothetical protein